MTAPPTWRDLGRRADWTWRETRALRLAIPRILRSPLTAPELFARLGAVTDASERRMWRALRWCMDAGSVVRVGPFRHGATYSAAALEQLEARR